MDALYNILFVAMPFTIITLIVGITLFICVKVTDAINARKYKKM